MARAVPGMVGNPEVTLFVRAEISQASLSEHVVVFNGPLGVANGVANR